MTKGSWIIIIICSISFLTSFCSFFHSFSHPAKRAHTSPATDSSASIALERPSCHLRLQRNVTTWKLMGGSGVIKHYLKRCNWRYWSSIPTSRSNAFRCCVHPATLRVWFSNWINRILVLSRATRVFCPSVWIWPSQWKGHVPRNDLPASRVSKLDMEIGTRHCTAPLKEAGPHLLPLHLRGFQSDSFLSYGHFQHGKRVKYRV